MLWNDAMERVLTTVLAEASEDIVGIWLVLRWIREAFPGLDDATARAATLDVIRRALASGNVVAGSFLDTPSKTFEVWNLDSRGAIDRIEHVWNALGRDPDIGENLWLVGKELHYVTLT